MSALCNYGYDENGNRVGVSIVIGANNKLKEDDHYDYEYDRNGNLIKRTSQDDDSYTIYYWDYRNRLYEVEFYDENQAPAKDVLYTYDQNNLRIGKTVDETTFGNWSDATLTRWILDGLNEVLEFSDGDLTHRYFYEPGIDHPAADERIGTADAGIYWLFADPQGSIVDVVTWSTTVVDRITYDAFGNATHTDNDFQELFGFTGRDFDYETGWQYNRARWYDPATGRWSSEDPIGFQAGDANLYRYVGNSPTNATDPLGLKVHGTMSIWLRNYVSTDPARRSLGEAESWITWYPPDIWNNSDMCNTCKKVELFQIADTRENWYSKDGTETVVHNTWHDDEGVPFLEGYKVWSVGGQYARVKDNPGLDRKEQQGWFSEAQKLRQEWETGAICVDKDSKHYLEILGVIRWGHDWIATGPDDYKRYFVKQPFNVTIVSHDLWDGTSIQRGPAPGGTPDWQFVKLAQEKYGDSTHW